LLEKFSEAKADLRRLLSLHPKIVNAYIGLGKVCNRLNNYEEALAYLDRASGLEKRNALIYPEKVKTLIGLERYDQALRVSDTAVLIKEDP